MAYDATARTVDAAGQRTRIVEAGSGFPVVVLHGWGGRIESMAPVIDCLARSFRVVALDLPGFGEAPPPPSAWGTPEYAEFVAGHVRSAGIERAHWVGHSFGAKASLYLAATAPALVEKLVLVGSPGLRTAVSLRARLKRAASKGARAAAALGPPGRALKAAVYRRIASQDYNNAGELRPVLVRVVNEDLSELLPRVAAPTLLVWGGKDDAVPVAHARAMERAIPDAGLVLFEDAGHFAYLDEPDRFCRVVTHFFSS